MRHAIISDIHGNLEAFSSVVACIESSSIDSVWCLGDIIGYGANPRECIDVVKKLSDGNVAGNHEYAIFSEALAGYFNSLAYHALQWTKQQLKEEDITCIKTFPLLIEKEIFSLVHGSPRSPEEFYYVFDSVDAERAFSFLSTRVCFVGHTHVPALFIEGEYDDGRLFPGTYQLDITKRYLINPGSVGQPRDTDKRASFLIFDDKEFEIELIRLDYDNMTATRKIRAAGLPDYLADRLL